jgi:DNA-binding protein H-NS
MAKSLSQIEKQIAVLQRRADAIKRREAVEVITRIKQAIAHYKLTAQDLGFGPKPERKTRGPGKKTAAKRVQSKRKTVGVVKFRDDAGHTWTGHGRRPDWYLAAIAQGKTPADLAA